jgi:predicted small metal-binding protein
MAEGGGKSKQLSCRDAVGGCDFVVRAATEEQVIELALDHACFSHIICDNSLALKEKLRAFIEDVPS